MARQRGWTTADSAALYGIDSWGKGYFAVDDAGHLTVTPDGQAAPAIDLDALVREVAERGIGLPLLIRFSGLLEARLTEIHEAFATAIDEAGYGGSYRGVYPIKVNQNRRVVEDLMRAGRRWHYGLEAGSKPELLAVMAMLSDPEALVVCNGYKDDEYIETALLASRLGPRVVLVVEKAVELDHIIATSRRLGVRPRLGVRARLASRGSGHWEASGGDRSKFGLGAREIVEAVETLRAQDLLDGFELLHFHLGSQISSIHNIKKALREGGWLYVNLVQMGVPLAYLDVGGGLGVNYDGSRTNSVSSINYSLQEYANDVVWGIQEVCDPAGVAHPTLVTEAGRATVAHHAVLVTEVLGVGEQRAGDLPDEAPPESEPAVGHLLAAYRDLEPANLLETYHDVQRYRDECLTLFNLGHLSLDGRVLAEDVYWASARKIRALMRDREHPSTELHELETLLADTYFCNFSIFQSLPDSWAIDQVFPVMPIHRLAERPERRGILADITCDSDGKIDAFLGDGERGRAEDILPLHVLRPDEPYHLGIFLVGAYQEILGDLHNLFGDTNAVHVVAEEGGGYAIDHVEPGDSVTEVLGYVDYPRAVLLERLRRNAERALRAGRMSREQVRELVRLYELGLSGYTYLERD